MLEQPRYSFDERAVTYAAGTDFWNILTDEMHSLYLLSFLLTADLDKAGQCFASGMGECEEEIGVFMAWAQARARRTILNHAIWMIRPAPERAEDFSSALRKGSATYERIKLFDAILGLNAFERFVYVMSVLEKQSDDDCSTQDVRGGTSSLRARWHLNVWQTPAIPGINPLRQWWPGEPCSRIITPEVQVISVHEGGSQSV